MDPLPGQLHQKGCHGSNNPIKMRSSLSSLTLILFLFVAVIRAATDDSVVTIYAWPLSSQSPSPMATIALSRHASEPHANIQSYTAPSKFQSQDEVIRIGLYDPSTKAWTGTATSAKAFGAGATQKLALHIDDKGHVWNVAFSASVPVKTKLSKDKKEREKQKQEAEQARLAREKQPLEIEVVPPTPAPQPVLNKPVVLNLDGKVDEQPADERSFLQK
jgi:hypothetical protein